MSNIAKQKVYLLLSALFCTILVTGNLIFQKFINIGNDEFLTFEMSVGVLLYPITFIVTDLITEFYGKSMASYTVKVGIFCDVVTMGLVYISNALPATHWSPINDSIFAQVFSVYGLASVASLIACFIAQSVDIILFSWVKKLTGKRMLWFRCNFSTIVAQLIDTISVNSLLSIFGIIPASKMIAVIINSFLFKLIAAVFFSTPLFYACYYAINYYLRENSVKSAKLQMP